MAIATALMPPLCTAGYGIATGQWTYFGGAMYLFCINAVFIALATFLVCKLLKFPMVKYANQAKRKRVSRLASLIGFLVLLPSVWLFYQLYQDQVKQSAASSFVKEIVQYEGMRPNDEWDKATQTLDIVMLGVPVPEVIVEEWRKKFKQTKYLKSSSVRFYQGSSMTMASNEGVEIVQEELIEKLRLIQDKDIHIKALEDQLMGLHEKSKDFNILSEEVRLNYPQIASMSYAASVQKDFITQKTDTTAVYNIIFNDSTLPAKNRLEVKTRMANWLRYRLQSDKIKINEVKAKITVASDSVK